ncbi:MAG: hypothetical protein KatS3mg082_2961 [Nitrospiraceae bacterium]|nr:MAG: hypothetical protein KatS3mg082_2961 [Nitrospiraceae bacterium]
MCRKYRFTSCQNYYFLRCQDCPRRVCDHYLMQPSFYYAACIGFPVTAVKQYNYAALCCSRSLSKLSTGGLKERLSYSPSQRPGWEEPYGRFPSVARSYVANKYVSVHILTVTVNFTRYTMMQATPNALIAISN